MEGAIGGPFGILGTGVIGAGWATRALAHGHDVVAFDPAPGAEARLRAAVARAWQPARKLGLHPEADPARLRFAASAEEVAAGAGFIQESVPEIVDLKRSVLATLDAVASPDVIIASSTSGILPSLLQRDLRHPERLVVGHPFNPVYLLPLVEVVGGDATSPEAAERATATYLDLGMRPLRVRNEIEGFLSDRLQEAMWREILHLVADGVATTGELDDAIVYGPGLRWAVMGTNLTFHLAGGEAGMRHMLEQFGPALEWPWTKLKAPPLTEELIDRMVTGTSEQAAGRDIAELERLRDDALVAIMYALRETGLGAGGVLNARGGDSAGDPVPWTPGTDVPCPLPVNRCRVAPDWTDDGQHLTDIGHAHAFQTATDAFMRYIGAGEQGGWRSHRTTESHVVHHRHSPGGAPLRFTAQLLGHDAHTIHLFIAMHNGHRDELVATNERIIIHGDPAAALPDRALSALAGIWESHRHAPRPEQSVMSITR